MPRCKHKLTGDVREYHVYRRGYAMPEWCEGVPRVLYDGDVIVRHPDGKISHCAPHTFDEWYEVIADEPPAYVQHNETGQRYECRPVRDGRTYELRSDYTDGWFTVSALEMQTYYTCVADDEPQRFTYHDYGQMPQWFTDWLKSKRDVKLCHNGSIIVDGFEIRPGDTLHYDGGTVERTTPLTKTVMKLNELEHHDTARRIITDECEKKGVANLAAAYGDEGVVMRAVMRALKGDY